ncbi:MAG: hypothetical protein ACKVIO_06275, partial [Phycisphaerales bacterium]
AQGCISFQVEWTYDEGVGEAVNANNIWYSGYQYDDVIAQPWFGSSYTYNLDGESDQYNIAFRTLTQFTLDANDGSTNDFAPVSVEPYLIEPYFDNSDAAGVVPIPTIFANGARTNEYLAKCLANYLAFA